MAPASTRTRDDEPTAVIFSSVKVCVDRAHLCVNCRIQISPRKHSMLHSVFVK